MALQDICSFKDSLVHHKAFPSSPLEDTVTSIHMTDYRWRRLDTSEKNSRDPLNFVIPPLPIATSVINQPSSAFCLHNHSVTVRRPFPLSHGTTTLGFIFQGGVIAAADTRASAAGLVQCPTAQKITPIHSHLVVTSSGSAADCMLWERILIREIRLYQLRHRRRLSTRGIAKLLSFMLHPFKGTDVCVALTLCGWDQEACTPDCAENLEETCVSDDSNQNVTATRHKPFPNSGPKLIYVCSNGERLQGDVFSVGSGSPYAYGVLDGGLRWSLSKEEAIHLAREAVFRATHRDAYSGNNVDLFHITANGWSRKEREDLKEEYYRDMERRSKCTEGKKKSDTTEFH